MKLIIRNKKIKINIYILVYTFILIFAPPILPRINFILALYSIYIIILKYRKQVMRIMHRSGMYIWVIAMIGVSIYELVIIGINGIVYKDIVNFEHYVHLFNRYFVLTFVMLSCSIYMIAYLKEKKYTQNQFIELIIHAGLLESLLTIISFVSPQVKSIFILLMKKFGGSELMENTWYITVRSYGFAGTLVDLFGLAMGIIAGISFFYGFTERKQYIFYSILVMIAGMLNARTTIIIYAIGILLTFLIIVKKMNFVDIFKCIIGIIIIILVMRLLWQYIISYDNPTTSWIKAGIEDLLSMFNAKEKINKQSGFAFYLKSDEWWELPKEWFRLFFGTGHSRYEAAGYTHSDIGYVNDIWFIGIFGVVMLYGCVVMSILRCIKHSSSFQIKFLTIFFICVFFVFNIKGSLLGYNPGSAVIFLVMYEINFLCNDKSIILEVSNGIRIGNGGKML